MYCGNNPINNDDRTGHSWKSIINAIAKVAKAAVKAVAKTAVKAIATCYVRPKVKSFEYKYKKIVKGTKSISFSLSGAYGAYGSGTIGCAIDGNGNIASVAGWAMGGGFPSFSGTVNLSSTNAPSVNDLAGFGTQVGGSVAVGIYSVGADATFFNGQDGNTYGGIGASFGVGVKALPFEVHGALTRSYVHSINVFDLFDDAYKSVMEW